MEDGRGHLVQKRKGQEREVGSQFLGAVASDDWRGRFPVSIRKESEGPNDIVERREMKQLPRSREEKNGQKEK